MPSPHSRTFLRQSVVHHYRNQRNDAEVDAQHEAGGQRVGHAALEYQVGIHQPVADDGPTESERQKHQRQSRQLGQQPGMCKSNRNGMA